MYKVQMGYFLHVNMLSCYHQLYNELPFRKLLMEFFSLRILKDLFISSIHLSWSWTIFNFFASFVCSWAFFAVIWYLIALIHGE